MKAVSQEDSELLEGYWQNPSFRHDSQSVFLHLTASTFGEKSGKKTYFSLVWSSLHLHLLLQILFTDALYTLYTLSSGGLQLMYHSTYCQWMYNLWFMMCVPLQSAIMVCLALMFTVVIVEYVYGGPLPPLPPLPMKGKHILCLWWNYTYCLSHCTSTETRNVDILHLKTRET